MLISFHPIYQQIEIDCNQIKTFYSLHEAQVYAKLKGYMVIKEQGEQVWKTMPKYEGVLTGGCYENN